MTAPDPGLPPVLGRVGERVLVPIERGWVEYGTIIEFDGKLATIQFSETIDLPDRLGGGCMIECQRELEELEPPPPWVLDSDESPTGPPDA